ncbi:MAG: TRAP transporter substrate-binding protein, partial [Pseudolabrys sp.]
ASIEQRADSARLNTTLKDELIKKGLAFESADRPAFRAALTQAGFYKEWRDKFGAETWAALEAVVGPLS